MQTLKAQRIWGCWIFTVVKGKKTKKPISVHGGETGADEAHSCTWGTYEEAVEAKEKYGYDGIFFVVLKGYFFLDIDHRDLNDPYVKVLLERFPTYSEMSVSGNGIHIYGLCDVSRIPSYTDAKGRLKLQREFYTKHPVKQIELYIGGLTNRLAVFTGNAVNDFMLTDCTNAILTTLDKDMRRKPKIQYSEKRDGDDKRIFDLITALRKQKNGGKFSKLFDSGDISDYGSQSEADLALCAIISFRTGNDPELMKSFGNRRSTVLSGTEMTTGNQPLKKVSKPVMALFISR